jgi:membrane protein
VPLLAVSFSVLKAFGVHNKLEPFLLNALTAMGPKATEITANIIQFVENMKIGVLGALGLGFLFYTVVALIQKIERTFNYTWRISQHRPFAQRVSDYLSVIIIGPVLVFSAMGLTASLMSSELMQQFVSTDYIGPIIQLITKLTPYLLIITAFTFFYILIPNTKVKFSAALTGAFVAGILWQTTGLAFASFIVGSAKYTAIYSALATLVMFMIWLYLAWLILLIGASIAFYSQNPERMTLKNHGLELSITTREKLAFMTMLLVARHYYQDKPAWSLEALSHHFNIPADTLDTVIQPLEQDGMLQTTADDPPVFLPGHPLDTTPLKNVLNAIREERSETPLHITLLPEEKVIDDLTQHIDQALDTALQDITIKDLAMSTQLIRKT